MNALDQLLAIRATIEKPDCYFVPSGKYDAKMANGKPCSHRNPKATAFTLIGAWNKCSGRWDFSALLALCDAWRTLGFKDFIHKSMRDFAQLPHSEIMILINKAIENQERLS